MVGYTSKEHVYQMLSFGFMRNKTIFQNFEGTEKSVQMDLMGPWGKNI